jgi:hypothetical protein
VTYTSHKPEDEIAYVNTDREIWRDVQNNPFKHAGDYYADSIHVTEQGGIGINVGGTVYVLPLRKWHALAAERFTAPPRTSQFDPKQPEKGWHEATPLPEPRIWKLWRWLRLMR